MPVAHAPVSHVISQQSTNPTRPNEHTHTHTHTHSQSSTHTHTHTRVCVFLHTTHVCVCMCVCLSCVCVCLCVCAYNPTHMRSRTGDFKAVRQVSAVREVKTHDAIVGFDEGCIHLHASVFITRECMQAYSSREIDQDSAHPGFGVAMKCALTHHTPGFRSSKYGVPISNMLSSEGARGTKTCSQVKHALK